MEFLGKIAQAFYEREREDISKLCFVFPGRRAALFFQRELGELIDRPIFSPSLITISDLFTELSGLRKADKLDCVYKLYKIYSSLNETPESFDDFVYWGETLVSDFDDTDKFIADAPKLFANIKDLKELDADYSFLSERQFKAIQSFWSSFHNGEESSKKSKFKALWSLMLPLYLNLRKQLEEEKSGYEGMIYRKIAEGVKNGETSAIDTFLRKYKRVVFVGFNALNECEKVVMSYVKNSQQGDFYWDYNGDFVTDPDNKASFFIQENRLRYPSSIQLNFLSNSKTEIEVIGAPTSVGQAKIAGEIASQLPAGINSAIVLPDESLLTTLMRSLDDSNGEINITMGYPLREASVVSLAEALIELQTGGLYYRKVLPVLRHTYIKGVTGNKSYSIERDIVSGNMIYVPYSIFVDDPLLSIVFKRLKLDESSSENNILNLSTYILDILNYIVKNKEINKFEKELIYYFYTLIVRIKDLSIPMSFNTYLRLLRQLVNSTSVPFKGEPLAGLQVMGVLETRCLDFDNIIICSMNEGVFPSRNINNSFIPLNLRRAFSLPDNEYADAVSAYNFYRTISRARKVWLIHDTRSEGLLSGEQSRFILQLKFHYNVSLCEEVASGIVTRQVKNPISVEKSDNIKQKLNSFITGEKSFSASSLSTYITCPLKFYFTQIEEVREEEELSESVEAKTFGTILHSTMAALYKDFEGRDVSLEDIKSKLSNSDSISALIQSEFKKEKKIMEVMGYNYVVCNLIEKYIHKILLYDLSIAPFRYIESEKRFYTTLKLDDGTEVKLKAFVDRIDRLNGELRIVDYKTGGNPDKMISISSLFEPNSAKKISVFFQLFLYAFMVNPNNNSLLSPYFLRELGTRFDKTAGPVELNEFKEHLVSKIAEILNPQIPFGQTENIKSCDYCPFKQICR
jgi:CRISPR/Cas system-associated exonuclease Cas4 (RecB family)